MYVLVDGLGSKEGRAHCHNSAQMMNSEPVGERERERRGRERSVSLFPNHSLRGSWQREGEGERERERSVSLFRNQRS